MLIHAKKYLESITVLQCNTKIRHIIYSINTNVIFTTLFVASFLASSLILIYSASALTYETGTNVQFTFNPALSLSVSGDLLISDLSPNTVSDSNIITVNVKTNNRAGYSLQVTTGNATYDTTELTNTTFVTASAPKFTSLNTTDSIDTLSNFSPNTWGYSYSNNDGTTWTSYSGLPLYTNAGTVISSSTAAAEETTKFKIAASAAATQTAGDYQNVVNFYAVTNKAPVSFFDAYKANNKTMYNGYYTMQDMSTSICEAVDVIGDDGATMLIDVRDDEVYTVAKLKDDRCWMLDNLRLDLANINLAELIGATNAADESLYYLKNGGGTSPFPATPVSTTWLDRYADPRIVTGYKNNLAINYGHGSGKIGVYYNYCAASAGSYCYRPFEGDGDAEEDICSTNWRMPSGGDVGEYKTLYAKYGNTDYEKAEGVKQALSITLSGWFYNNEIKSLSDAARIWSSVRLNENDVYDLYADKSSVRVASSTQGVYGRMGGASVRCIVK